MTVSFHDVELPADEAVRRTGALVPKDLQRAFTAVVHRLIFLVAEDAELRSQVRQLAVAFLEANDSPATDRAAVAPAEPQGVVGEITASLPIAIDAAPIGSPHAVPITQLPELTLGRPAPTVPLATTSDALNRSAVGGTDLSVIADRCRLKAEGARWAATRKRLLRQGTSFATEIEPSDRDIIARAKQISDCFLWMCHSSGPNPTDLALFENVAGCFEAVADVVALLKELLDDRKYQADFERCLDLLAESQSSLRVAIAATGEGRPDSDQVLVFDWLRAVARERQIRIQRHMRIDDPADPSRLCELRSRIEAADSAMQERKRRTKQRRKLLGKVRHKASLIADDSRNVDAHWRLMASTVDELVSDGLPPSDRELRELLVPIIDRVPELGEVPQAFDLALHEVRSFMANCPRPEPTPELLRKELDERSGGAGEEEIPSTDNYGGVQEWAKRHLTGRLVLHSRALRGLKDAVFEDVQLVYKCQLLLANEYRSQCLGRDGAKAAFDRKCEELGLRLARSISKERAGEQRDEYFVRFPKPSSPKRFLEWHLCKGSAKEDRYCLRIYFFFHEDTQEVVVGWLPSHLSTRMT